MALRLWSDEPAEVDLLAFGAVADTVVDVVLDDNLDPLALGLSGAWGSGKSTVLRLVRASLVASERIGCQERVLTLLTVPWCYDPAVGTKQSLIGEVLACLEDALAADGEDRPGLSRLRGLIERVNWAKALQVAARSSLTLQLPSVDALAGLLRSRERDETDSAPRTLEAFRHDFSELMASKELSGVKRLVVLVDDLDRCLPETVVETLETIRLFLAVPKMAFVIAADEVRVADAIGRHYRNEENSSGQAGRSSASESPARLYLHKMVQTTVPIPGLSRFDTEAYLFLLQLLNDCEPEQVKNAVTQCEQMRRNSGSLSDIESPEGVDSSEALEFARRLTPILYEKLQGNPRRIKRFLNDLHVRQSVADRRGIALNTAIVAKLMVLETLLPEGFKEVLDWFAENQLRERISALEETVGPHEPEGEVAALGNTRTETNDQDGTEPVENVFSPELLRWAKLAPPLAAAFRGTPLLDTGLPGHLLDTAANLVSGVRAEQKLVTEADLSALSPTDADALIRHLATAARDRPTEQTAAIRGLLRIVRVHTNAAQRASILLAGVPANELHPATVLLFEAVDIDQFRQTLTGWLRKAPQGPIRRALNRVVGASDVDLRLT